MQNLMVVLCLALLMWAGAASAQSTYSVTVSRHSGTDALSEQDVRDILSKASKMLQKKTDHVDTDDDVACNVIFTLKGPVRTFASPDTPATIINHLHRDAVHRDGRDDMDGADFNVKVVEEINFCRPGLSEEGQTEVRFAACAFNEIQPAEFRSIIVVHPKTLRDIVSNYPDHLLWAHEFGHLTGLGHRNEKDSRALMTACGVHTLSNDSDKVQVNRNECSCLRSGPESCLPLPPSLGCPR